MIGRLAPALVKADRAKRSVVLRRLNRVEYENTVRDLLKYARFHMSDGKKNVIRGKSLRAADGFRTVVDAAERDLRMAPGQLAGDLAGAAADVYDRAGARHVRVSEIGKPANGDGAGIGGVGRIVAAAFEDGVVVHLVGRW